MNGVEALAPYSITVKVHDPDPDSDEYDPPDSPSCPSYPAPGWGATTSYDSDAANLDNSCGPIVLQEYLLAFKVRVQKKVGDTSEHFLAIPWRIEGRECDYGDRAWFVRLSIYQPTPERRCQEWDIKLKVNEKVVFPIPDDGPPFVEVVLENVFGSPAVLEGDYGLVEDPDQGSESGYRESYRATSTLEQTIDFSSNAGLKHVMLTVFVVLKRRFTRIASNYHSSSGRKQVPKLDLLASADRTGDLILVGREGVELPAHSAVLVDIPYFEARLREEWSGKAACNLHSKLRLELPYRLGKKALKAFLTYVYGDTRTIFKNDPTVPQLLQDVLSLADACGVAALSADIVGLVIVTSANVDSWLAWLLKEHGVDASPIQKQVVEVMKTDMQKGVSWEKLTVEQLAAVASLRRSLPDSTLFFFVTQTYRSKSHTVEGRRASTTFTRALLP